MDEGATTEAEDLAAEGICPHCGEEMKLGAGDFSPASIEEQQNFTHGEIAAVWVCENVDCPSREVDMAKAREPGTS